MTDVIVWVVLIYVVGLHFWLWFDYGGDLSEIKQDSQELKDRIKTLEHRIYDLET